VASRRQAPAAVVPGRRRPGRAPGRWPAARTVPLPRRLRARSNTGTAGIHRLGYANVPDHIAASRRGESRRAIFGDAVGRRRSNGRRIDASRRRSATPLHRIEIRF
jgi:hypothetical protein